MTWELNPATNDVITAAIKQRHRIMACPSCGGPQIFSLTEPKSRCFRCNRYQEGTQLKQNHRLRCDECHHYFKVRGLKIRYCQKCSRKRELERKNRAINSKVAQQQERLQKASETDHI